MFIFKRCYSVRFILISCVFCIAFMLCGSVEAIDIDKPITKHFDPDLIPDPPDYSKRNAWGAVPGNFNLKKVDVVYFHPTTFMDHERWNEPMEEAGNNEKTRNTLVSQAGVFADTCNIYMPLYRQASIISLSAEEKDKDQAIELAYSDISKAFEYYIKNFNKGRPFVLAGHSQGSELLLMLLKRKFGEADLRKKLIVSYVIGWSVVKDDIKNFPYIRMSEFPEDVGCVISYNTQSEDPEYSIVREGAVSVNPLLWNTSEEFAPKELNLGAVFLMPDGKTRTFPDFTGAQNKNGALVIPAPDAGYGLSVPYKGFYHGYDYSFFYKNIQRNVKDRIKAYFEKDPV